LGDASGAFGAPLTAITAAADVTTTRDQQGVCGDTKLLGRGYAAFVVSTELAEVMRYLRRIDATGADEQGSWRGGSFIRTRSLPLVYDANRVVVLEHGFGLSMEEVSTAADTIQAGLPNRIVEFVDCAESASLADGFIAAGWLADPVGVMVRLRDADRVVDTGAVLVADHMTLAPARMASLNDEVWATGDAAAQVREKQERIARSLPTTHLAVMDDGNVVAYCEVFEIDADVAQIESVATVPAFRGRGHARAVVARALHLTRDRRLVFLTMDPTDWPQELYAKLGFDDIGRVLRFRRALLG
jgi:ribosomal protein S18 acetylase RimI-like enzyme